MKYFEIEDRGETIRIAIQFASRYKVGAKSDLLARTLGKRKNVRKQNLLVVDATAGLCRDSVHFLSLGCEVVALERNSQLYEAFSQLPSPANFRLVHAEAVQWLSHLSKAILGGGDHVRPDVVYLDPMFPEKKKSAAASKESRILQLLETPPTPDEERELLRAARGVAGDRVIVKRPKHAPWLAGEKPSHEFLGKAVRYDVYVTPKQIF